MPPVLNLKPLICRNSMSTHLTHCFFWSRSEQRHPTHTYPGPTEVSGTSLPFQAVRVTSLFFRQQTTEYSETQWKPPKFVPLPVPKRPSGSPDGTSIISDRCRQGSGKSPKPPLGPHSSIKKTSVSKKWCQRINDQQYQ